MRTHGQAPALHVSHCIKLYTLSLLDGVAATEIRRRWIFNSGKISSSLTSTSGFD
jgi:hypothetical protein